MPRRWCGPDWTRRARQPHAGPGCGLRHARRLTPSLNATGGSVRLLALLWKRTLRALYALASRKRRAGGTTAAYRTIVHDHASALQVHTYLLCRRHRASRVSRATCKRARSHLRKLQRLCSRTGTCCVCARNDGAERCASHGNGGALRVARLRTVKPDFIVCSAPHTRSPRRQRLPPRPVREHVAYKDFKRADARYEQHRAVCRCTVWRLSWAARSPRASASPA